MTVPSTTRATGGHSGPRRPGEVLRTQSAQSVIAGLDPAIHGVPRAPASHGTGDLDASARLPDAVDTRVKRGHDGVEARYLRPGSRGAQTATVVRQP